MKFGTEVKVKDPFYEDCTFTVIGWEYGSDLSKDANRSEIYYNLRMCYNHDVVIHIHEDDIELVTIPLISGAV